MRNFLKRIPILLIPLLILSCGKEDESAGGLEITVSSSSFLLPGDSSSCVGLNPTGDSGIALDVPPFRASFNKISMTWSKTAEDLSIAFIKLEFKHPNITGGSFTATISGPELDLLLGTFNGFAGHATIDTTDADGDGNTTEMVPLTFNNSATTFLPQTGISLNKTPCRLQAGGIPIENEDVNFTASGTITVVGIATGNGLEGANLAPGEAKVEDGNERALRVETSASIRFEFN